MILRGWKYNPPPHHFFQRCNKGALYFCATSKGWYQWGDTQKLWHLLQESLRYPRKKWRSAEELLLRYRIHIYGAPKYGVPIF